MATASGALHYKELNISEEDALKFVVDFEVFQRIEESHTRTKDNVGGSQTQTTEYSYKQEWIAEEIDSSMFEWPDGGEYGNSYVSIANLGLTPQKNADNITVGEYQLASIFVERINEYESYTPTEDILQTIKALAADALPEYQYITQRGNEIYLAQWEGTTGSIGDMRITFKIIRDQQVSIIGKQEGQTITAYRTSNGIENSMLSQQVLSAEEMIVQAKEANEMMKWVLRFLWVLSLFIGFSSLLRPLVVIADIIPLIGSIVGIGVGFVSGVATLLIASITIALAWIRFSPLIGGAVLITWLLVSGAIMKRRKKRVANKNQKNNEKSENNTFKQDEKETPPKKLLGAE